MRIRFFVAVTLSALAALAVMSLSGTPVRAQTDTPHKGSPGNDSCAQWSDAWTHRSVTDARLDLFDAFLNGYATAYNIYGPDDLASKGNNVLNNPLPAQHAFLEKYCTDHPLDLYLDAVNQLLADLRPKSGA